MMLMDEKMTYRMDKLENCMKLMSENMHSVKRDVHKLVKKEGLDGKGKSKAEKRLAKKLKMDLLSPKSVAHKKDDVDSLKIDVSDEDEDK